MKARPLAFFHSCASPADLDRAAGVEPLSELDELVLDAAAGARPTTAQLRAWASISRQPWPSKAPHTFIECVGRGSGKSTRLVKQALFHLLCRGHWAHALPGTRVYATVTAPTLRQASDVVKVGNATAERWRCLGVDFEVRDAGGDCTEITLTAPVRPCTMVLAVAPEGDTGRGRAHAFFGRTEAGHSRDGSDRATHQAIVPRLAQFPASQVYIESTPGRPAGLFFELVSRPPAGAVLVRGSSYAFNPRGMPIERCRELVPDAREQRQEIEAAAFGLAGDGWLDASAGDRWLDTGNEWCGRTFSPACSATGLDVAHKSDATAIVRAAIVGVPTRHGQLVRHVVVTHVERLQGTRERPLQTKAIAERAARVADGSPLVFDMHYSLDVAADVEAAAHYRKAEDATKARARTYAVAPMHAAAQTARMKLLREYANGCRLHIPDTSAGRHLVKELAELRAEELPSGLLRVEGMHTDDVADALALAVEVVHHLPPDVIDGEGGRIVMVRPPPYGSLEAGGIHLPFPRFFRELPNGRRAEVPPPEWDKFFPSYAARMLASGLTTPPIERWARRELAEGREVRFAGSTLGQEQIDFFAQRTTQGDDQ